MMNPSSFPEQVSAVCNAKVNLYLKVKGVRSDGFHEIETLYHSISLADTVTVSPASAGFQVDSNDQAVPRNGTNFAVRAAHRILAEVVGEAVPATGPSVLAGPAQVNESDSRRSSGPLGRGALIDIGKRIPIGSGLGGGSADAAGTLVCINRLYGLGHAMAALEGMAEGLGADTKFMLRGGCAIGRGIGSDLEFLPALPPLPVLVVVPNITVSTAWAYDSLKIRLTTEGGGLSMVASALEKGDVASLWNLLENDFESLIFEKFPVVREIKSELVRLGALAALMSGSGSAVYGVFEGVGDVQGPAEALSRRGFKVFVTGFARRGVTTPM